MSETQEQRFIDAAWAVGNDLMAANYLDMTVECCVPLIAKALERYSWAREQAARLEEAEWWHAQRGHHGHNWCCERIEAIEQAERVAALRAGEPKAQGQGETK